MISDSHTIVLDNNGIYHKLLKVLYGKDGSIYIMSPYHPSKEAIVVIATLNYSLETTIVYFKDVIDVASVEDDQQRLKLSQPWMGSATFTGGAGTNLGMPAGIVLSSGPVMYAAPWSPTPLSTQYIWTYGDDDLTVLAGGTPGSPYAITKDASVLEFDLVPNGDSIKFRFIFASDEYPEWVCSQYNDVFGFFLSGLGINGTFSNNSVNLAVIPGTNVPIAVNSINSGEVGGITFPYPESTCAETDPNWQDNSIYYVDNEFGPDVYYDGFTVVMEASSAVQCGETYHIKLAIADYVDAF